MIRTSPSLCIWMAGVCTAGVQHRGRAGHHCMGVGLFRRALPARLLLGIFIKLLLATMLVDHAPLCYSAHITVLLQTTLDCPFVPQA